MLQCRQGEAVELDHVWETFQPCDGHLIGIFFLSITIHVIMALEIKFPYSVKQQRKVFPLDM